MEPFYVARPGGMRLIGPLLAAFLALIIVATVVLLLFASTASGITTGVSLLVVWVVVWFVLPRRYEVWPEYLRVVFPMFGWNIGFDTIETIREGRWHEAWGFWGLRFATVPSQTVTILRHNSMLFRHPNLVISPDNRDEFLRQLERAMHR